MLKGEVSQNTLGRGCSEHALSRISWTALTLEVGKSPTEVTRAPELPVSPPSAICDRVRFVVEP